VLISEDRLVGVYFFAVTGTNATAGAGADLN
jgi:hypothetical protein